MRAIDRLRSVVSFVRLANDLNRLDEVFAFAETLRAPELLEEGVDYHRRTAEGARALAERPRLGKLDFDVLAQLPPGTLGRALADNMQRAGLSPDSIPTLRADNEQDYVFAHYYETHDVWHTLTGFATDKAGELGLQAFYLGQGAPARLSAMILSAGFLELLLGENQFEDRGARLREVARGYVMGHRAEKLFGVRWNQLWDQSLEDVRKRYRIDLDFAAAAIS